MVILGKLFVELFELLMVEVDNTGVEVVHIVEVVEVDNTLVVEVPFVEMVPFVALASSLLRLLFE